MSYTPILKIEHFYAVSTRPEELYKFLNVDFGLPEVWPFTDYGGFSSGGLSLGNVVLEIVGSNEVSEHSLEDAYFHGIAFEPIETAESMVRWLDNKGYAHSSLNPFKEFIDGIERTHWVTFDIDIPPKNSRIFVCDYKNRKLVEGGRKIASHKLLNSDINSHQIKGLNEITIMLKDTEEGGRLWSQLLGSEKQAAPGEFEFQEGPCIKLVPAEKDKISEISITVDSLHKTKKFLKSKGLFGSEINEKLIITPSAIQGLNISFIEV